MNFREARTQEPDYDAALLLWRKVNSSENLGRCVRAKKGSDWRSPRLADRFWDWNISTDGVFFGPRLRKDFAGFGAAAPLIRS